MQTVWIIHYLNKYLVDYGVFATRQDALDFVAEFEHADWYVPVELPVQIPGAIIETKNLPPQGQR